MVRKSVDRVRSIGKTKRFSPKRQNTQGSTASSHIVNGSQSSFENISPDERSVKMNDTVVCKEVPGIGTGLQTAYLLISPLQGFVSHLLTLFSSRSWKDQIPDHEMKLTVDPSLVVFGDDDIFISVKRLRSWASKLSEASKGSGRFRYAEVSGAGHFWQDFEAVKALQEEVKAFVETL
jgi:pimeloyl-ACP methyl ester carboxylesterase